MPEPSSENVRVSAAKELFDRQMPKVSKTQHEETTIIEFGDSIQNLALALADNMKIDPQQLTGKSDEEVIDLLEGEINASSDNGRVEGNHLMLQWNILSITLFGVLTAMSILMWGFPRKA